MRTVDIKRDDLVHRLLVTYGGTRTRVEPDCDHADPESVFAVLSGTDLHCEWPSAVLQHLLRRGVPFEEACAWAALPVTPHHPYWMALWKAPDHVLRWSLRDLEGWRLSGCTAEKGAEFCARHPRRSRAVKSGPT
jgi:hypothetical protein